MTPQGQSPRKLWSHACGAQHSPAAQAAWTHLQACTSRRWQRCPPRPLRRHALAVAKYEKACRHSPHSQRRRLPLGSRAIARCNHLRTGAYSSVLVSLESPAFQPRQQGVKELSANHPRSGAQNCQGTIQHTWLAWRWVYAPSDCQPLSEQQGVA